MKRLKILLGLTLVIVLGGIGATAGGVTPVSILEQPDETDTIDEIDDLVAYPDPGSEGGYAVFDDDGEIAIDLTEDNPNLEGDGVNPASFTGADEVVRLENTGTEPMTVWIDTDEADWLEFHADGSSLEGEDNAVVLEGVKEDEVGEEANNTLAIGFDIDVDTEETKYSSTFSIHAEVPDDGPGFIPYPPVESEVLTPDNETRELHVENARASVVVEEDLKSLQIGDGVILESIDIEYDRRVDHETTFETPTDDERFEPLESIPGETGAAVLGGYSVTDAPDEDTLEAVTYQYALDRAMLEDPELDPQNITLERYDEAAGEWSAVETTIVEQTEDVVVLEATRDSFSLHALTVDAPILEVAETAVDGETTLEVGDSLSVPTTLENVGAAGGTQHVDVTVDGETVTSVDATLEPGETETTNVSHTFEKPGTYEVAIGNAETIEVTVLEPVDDREDHEHADGAAGSDQHDGDEPTSEEPSNESDDEAAALEGSMASLAAGTLGILSLSLGTILVARRRLLE